MLVFFGLWIGFLWIWICLVFRIVEPGFLWIWILLVFQDLVLVFLKGLDQDFLGIWIWFFGIWIYLVFLKDWFSIGFSFGSGPFGFFGFGFFGLSKVLVWFFWTWLVSLRYRTNTYTRMGNARLEKDRLFSLFLKNWVKMQALKPESPSN